MPLLIPAIIILMLLMIIPCIINCLTQFFSVQVNMLQHAVTVQQGYINLQATMENITHLETSKRRRPNAPRCPSLAGNSQRDLNTPIPKELGISTLEGGMLGSQNRKKEFKMWWLKDKEGKSPQKQNNGRCEDWNENLR